jgi:hypothetical protein
MIINGSLLVACGNASKLLAPVDEPLNLIPLARDGPVERPCLGFIHLAWDHIPPAMAPQILPNLTAAIRLITHDAAGAVFGTTMHAPLHRTLGQELR